jgi:hypothetical protein
MQTKEKQKYIKIKATEKDKIAVIGLYLEPRIYETIKERAETKYTSMATIIRQAIGKMIKSGENV